MPETDAGDTTAGFSTPISPFNPDPRFPSQHSDRHTSVNGSQAWSDEDPKAPIDLSELNGIDSPERARIFKLVDDLRDLGINGVLSLPQLVVCGNQSSGKSSLLEGLTGLPFPVKSKFCTRFATQITLRRSPESECVLSIVPDGSKHKDPEAMERLRNFYHVYDRTQLSEERFLEEMDTAASLMGIGASANDGYSSSSDSNWNRRIFNDTLRVDISGPDEQNLTVIDIPGLVHNENREHFIGNEKAVREMTEKYMRQSRTIIMAVMPATSDSATEVVFGLARHADSEGKRTVGIMTKPDRVELGNLKQTMRFAGNLEDRLHHGWFVVRNRSPEEVERGMSTAERHEAEDKFFNQEPWNTLNRENHNCGVQALRSKLSQLLFDHTRNELPNLKKELETKLKGHEEELKRLGPERKSTLQKRRYLNEKSRDYQKQVESTLNGRLDNDLDSESPLRLQKHVNTAENWLTKELDKNGKAYQFDDICGQLSSLAAPQQMRKQPSDGRPPPFSIESPNLSDFSGAFGRLSVESPVDARPAWPQSNNKEPKIPKIYHWIEEHYQNSRGYELPGLIDPTKASALFRTQTRSWDGIAEQELQEVEEAINNFNHAIFAKLVGDNLVRQRILDEQMQFTTQTVADARERLAETLESERSILSTLNEEFTAKFNELRHARFLKLLKAHGLKEGEELRIQWEVALQLYRVGLAGPHNEATNQLHDILKAYYEISLPRFKDNVRNTVIRPLLNGANSPLNFFTPDWVGGLNDERLNSLTAEADEVRIKREELNKVIAQIKEALRTINAHRI